jgi:hypothetical protein
VKSYRGMIASLKPNLPEGCVASRGLSASHRAVLHYFGDIVTERLERQTGSECDLLLVQVNPGERLALRRQWVKLWEGARPGDTNERFVLYRRAEAKPSDRE